MPDHMKFFQGAKTSDAKQHPLVEKTAVKYREQHARWENTLNSMSIKNPLRIIGELIYKQLQEYHHSRLGGMILKYPPPQAAKEIHPQKTPEKPLSHEQQNTEQHSKQDRLAQNLKNRLTQKARSRDNDRGGRER